MSISSSASQLSFVDLSMRIHGGELNCEAKVQVLIVTPSPLFFLEVGRKKGGRNSGAVRYMHTHVTVSGKRDHLSQKVLSRYKQ